MNHFNCENCGAENKKNASRCNFCLIEFPIIKIDKDRRIKPRFQLKKAIKVEFEDGQVEHSLGNISSSGCMIHSFFDKKISLKAKINLSLENFKSFDLEGKVVRVQKNYPFLKRFDAGNLAIKQLCTSCSWKDVGTAEEFGDRCPACGGKLIKQVPNIFGIGIQFTEKSEYDYKNLVQFVARLHNLDKALAGQREASRINLDHFPAVVAVSIGSKEELFHTFVKDISSGGMFIVSDVKLEVGKTITLQIFSEDQNQFNFDAKVVHSRETEISGRKLLGYGIQFFPFNENVESQIETFLQKTNLKMVEEYDKKISELREISLKNEKLESVLKKAFFGSALLLLFSLLIYFLSK